MNWIFDSIFVILGSTILYLGLRWSQKKEVSGVIQNASMFFGPAIALFFILLATGTSFSYGTTNFVILAISSFALSYIPNTLSIMGIQKAPNSGYSLAISKSYAILPALASPFLFSTEIGVKEIVSIFLIVIFAVIISISSGKEGKQANKSWILYSMGAFFGWGFLALILFYLTNVQGENSILTTFYILIMASVFIATEMFFKNKGGKLKFDLLTFVIVSVGALIFNTSLINGYSVSPNPGYINAANTASISAISIFSWIIFKDKLSPLKLFSIIGIAVSVLILFI